MSISCAITPQVLNNKTGKVEDSRLFKDLLSLTSRQTAKNIYLKTKSEEFKTNIEPFVKLDDRGEPTFSSLITNTDVGDLIENVEEKFINKLNESVGNTKSEIKKYPKESTSYKDLVNRAIQFNETSEYKDEYVALVHEVIDSNPNKTYFKIEVYPKTKENVVEASKMAYNQRLNDKLTFILEEHGVAVGALKTLEERLGLSGVMEADKSKIIGEGLIELIRVANNEKGQQALPEEFAHFVFEAMGDSPLSKRIINNILDNNLAEEIIGDTFDDYMIKYNNDPVKLAKEAAGKLLARHLFKQVEVPSKPYKNLLERFIQAIKSFFSRWNATDIERAMITANKDMEGLANTLLNNPSELKMSLDKIQFNEKLYSINERTKKTDKLLERIIRNEIKRLNIYKERSVNPDFEEVQTQRIAELEKDLSANNSLLGINRFIEHALSQLSSLSARLYAMPSSDLGMFKRASLLRDIRNYIASYVTIIKDIEKDLAEERYNKDNIYLTVFPTSDNSNTPGRSIQQSLAELRQLANLLYNDAFNESKSLFVTFLKPFFNDDILRRLGTTIQDMTEKSTEDVGFWSRWIDSMAHSKDYMLKVMDQAVKKTKHKARMRIIDKMKEIVKIQLEAEKAGIKDFNWMFEYVDGDKSGLYIREINYSLYEKRKEEKIAELREKYGEKDTRTEEEQAAFKKELNEWINENTETIQEDFHTIRIPNKKYHNKLFEEIMKGETAENKAKKDFYLKMMAIKEELDSYLPQKYVTLHNAVKIRKDFIQRALGSKNLIDVGATFWESLKDNFIRRGDDNMFGIEPTLMDFENRQVQTLPIYYTKLREGESANDLSTDIAATMTAYAAMALEYDEMSRIIDILEVGRDVLREREVGQTIGKRVKKEVYRHFGNTIENELTTKGDETHFMQQLNDFFDSQVYGRYMKDQTLGKTDIHAGKTAGFINTVTALNTYALSLLTSISNVATGSVMMRTEAIAGQFFGLSDTFKADKIYTKELPKFLSEIGDRVKVSKLHLWSEYFNVLQDFSMKTRDLKFDHMSWFRKMFNTQVLFFLSNAGEHWMQMRTSLALANRYKMKSPTNEIVSLWDAMEVVYIDPKNPKLGAKLEVKDGYTKEDGTKFTIEDVYAFERQCSGLNHYMHGIYNQSDKNAFQRLAVGKLVMMFRGWLEPSFNRRFKGGSFNYDINAWQEGYYITFGKFVAGKFLTLLGKEIRETQFALAANGNHLSDHEKFNIARAIGELSQFLLLTLFMSMIKWDDKDKNPWTIRMAEYQTRRLFTEVGVLVPGPQILSEAFKILKSPAAGINTMENALNLVKLLNPYNYKFVGGEEATLDQGRYKGKSKAHKYFFDSPLIPMNRTIYRGLHPEESIPFFKNAQM